MYTKAEAKQMRFDFWEEFGHYSKSLAALRPNRGRWILYYTGIKSLELKFEVQRHLMRVMIEVNHRDESMRFDVYSQLEKYKMIIETEFGSELTWDYVFTTASGNDVCRIYVENADYDFNTRRNWPAMFKFLGKNMIGIEKAFREIKDFIEVKA